MVGLHRHYFFGDCEKCAGEHARARAHLKHSIAWPYAGLVHDALRNPRMHEEVLPQRFFCAHNFLVDYWLIIEAALGELDEAMVDIAQKGRRLGEKVGAIDAPHVCEREIE